MLKRNVGFHKFEDEEDDIENDNDDKLFRSEDFGLGNHSISIFCFGSE